MEDRKIEPRSKVWSYPFHCLEIILEVKKCYRYTLNRRIKICYLIFKLDKEKSQYIQTIAWYIQCIFGNALSRYQSTNKSYGLRFRGLFVINSHTTSYKLGFLWYGARLFSFIASCSAGQVIEISCINKHKRNVNMKAPPFILLVCYLVRYISALVSLLI